MDHPNLDSRVRFRLHAMDLEPATAPASHIHWMLRDKGLRRCIATLEKDYGEMCAAGGDPFGGQAISTDLVIEKLGFTNREEPQALWDQLKFTVSFFAAAIRKTMGIQAELSRLRQRARPGRWLMNPRPGSNLLVPASMDSAAASHASFSSTGRNRTEVADTPVSSGQSRTLRTMPADVFHSTLQARTGFFGGLFRKVRDVYATILFWLVKLSALNLMSWLFMFLLRNSQELSDARLRTSLIFAGLFFCCVLIHGLELVMALPLRDFRYPVVFAGSSEAHLLGWGAGYSLGMMTGAWAALLWLTWYAGWQNWAGACNTLRYAIANTALSSAMFLYGRFPPYYFFRKPSVEDREWLRSGAGRLAAGDACDQALGQLNAPPPQPAPASPPMQNEDYETPVCARPARSSFKEIFGMDAVKQRLLQAARAIVSSHGHGEAPANGILMHGAPGNGKTVFAEALAGELGVSLVSLTYGDVVSKWLGQTPRQICNCFKYAKEHAPCVFFIDEIDSFLRSRDSASNNTEDLKITNTLLTEIVALRGHKVVLVAATNFLSMLDGAAIREGRFDFKVEITAPDEAARIGLLKHGAAKFAAHLDTDQAALVSIARRWNGFSVSRLLAVAKELPVYAKESQLTRIGFDHWMAALRRVQGRKGAPPANTKPLSELILAPDTRDALNLIAGRLKDAERIEAMGGTLPNGIFFHGPSGTGKTAAARALALDCGWAFISVAGADLAAERDKINRVYAEAADIRPALIFIDEADDILRDRQFSSTADIVNRLLVLMDGSEERVKDVVFIAAANHPELIDPALMRAGRFSEKVEFLLPRPAHVRQAVARWLKLKQAVFEPGVNAACLGELFATQSIANIEGILQYALNKALARTCNTEAVVLSWEDLRIGLRLVASSLPGSGA